MVDTTAAFRLCLTAHNTGMANPFQPMDREILCCLGWNWKREEILLHVFESQHLLTLQAIDTNILFLHPTRE